MRANHASRRGVNGRQRCGAFTLTELLVVIGLIAVMLSMLMPALGKVRAAANSANCLSNLRQMGVAWTMYTVESKGRLPEYMFSASPLIKPETVWRGYWLGVLESYKVRGEVLLCPQASERAPESPIKGYGTIWQAWTGKHNTPGNVLRLNGSLYRDGSYGYNRYMTAGGGFARDLAATKLTSIRPLAEVPLFMDCVYIEAGPENGTLVLPAPAPPNLRGSGPEVVNQEHWRFLIARHGRAVNVCMADGSARRVPLEEMYMLQWKAEWLKYRLTLPAY